MSASSDTSALIRKLVRTGHLSVPERAPFRHGGVPGSLVTASILHELEENRIYPIELQDADCFCGGLIEQDEDGTCRIKWMGEVGVGRYAVLDHRRCESAAAAAATYARRFFGDNIDGIPVDWSR